MLKTFIRAAGGARLRHDGAPPCVPTPPVPDSAPPPRRTLGRRPSITREDLLAAALALLGPNRSVSTLGLREVAREARIAPNSFYRHFRDIDELAVSLIERAGVSLRMIIGQARRQRASSGHGVVRCSVEAFFAQLSADDQSLHLLLREGLAGSDAFKQAVDRELRYFEEELRVDLVLLAEVTGVPLHEPAVVARAITRLVFAVGASAMDMPRERYPQQIDELTMMVKMIVIGARAMHAPRS
jgi:AcrR family transcriptional regulator